MWSQGLREETAVSTFFMKEGIIMSVEMNQMRRVTAVNSQLNMLQLKLWAA